jgi:Ca2+-transporting ATPase
MNIAAKLKKIIVNGVNVLTLVERRFSGIDGSQRAGAFAYYTFFSLFPLIILFITIASAFIDKEQAGNAVIGYIGIYAPIGAQLKRQIFGVLSGLMNARGQAGVAASVILFWSANQFIKALIVTSNRAWRAQVYNWWQLPLKSLVLFCIMAGVVLVGILVPVAAQMLESLLFPVQNHLLAVYRTERLLVPMLVLFFGLSLFYKIAPRKEVRYSQVWLAALAATLFLRAGELLFLIYLKNFTAFNAVYGVFGGIMALLLWIYISGYIIIFGVCLCAVMAEPGSDRECP